MSTTDPNRPARSSEGRSGGGAPRSSSPVIAIVIAAVAGLLALLILRDVTDNDDGDSGGDTPKTTTTQVGSSTTTAGATSTTTPLVRAGATVLVANCSGKEGVAGNLTTLLKNRGYTTGSATNCTGDPKSVTVIQVKSGDAAAAVVARTLAYEMGVTAPLEAMPANPVIEDGKLGSATVLVLLAPDKADEPLRSTGATTQTTEAATATTDDGETATTSD